MEPLSSVKNTDLEDFVVGDDNIAEVNLKNSTEDMIVGGEEFEFDEEDDDDYYDDDEEEFLNGPSIVKSPTISSVNNFNNNNNTNNNNNNNNNSNNNFNNISNINNNNNNSNNNKNNNKNNNNKAKKDINDVPIYYRTKLDQVPFDIETGSLQFLIDQGITSVGMLATMTDLSIILDGVHDDPTLEIIQSMCRNMILEANPNEFLADSSIKTDQINVHSSLLVLAGLTQDDEQYLQTLGVLTLGQFVQTGKTNTEISNSPRLKFFCDMAQKLLSHAANSQNKTVVKPVKEARLYGYYYCSTATLRSIQVRGFISSYKMLFEDFITQEVSIRFNHPWRKVYFRYVKQASKETKITNPTDLDVYSYLVYLSASDFFNSTGSVTGIHFFWTQILQTPTGCNFIDLKLHKPEFQHLIKIDLTSILEKHWRIYDFSNGSLRRLNDKEELTRQCKERSEWSKYKSGEDPYLTIGHGYLIPDTGFFLSKDFYEFDDE